jgi:hypothetical protein
MIRQQPGRPGVNPLKAGGNAGGLEQGYQQPQGNQPKGMDLSSYAPGRAQPIQPPSQGTPFQAYNQQQSAPRSPPQFGGDVMFAGGTPYFNERPGPMPRQQKAAPPRETPAVGAQPQVPFTQSAVGVGGQQFSDPSQAFAQRDALIQRINEARAPMFANSGMYMGGAAPPPPQPLDFNALLGQANEMVAGGWQNPFAATTFAPPSQPPVAGMNPGYGNPYVMNTGAGTPFPEAELGDGGRQYYDWAINNPNDPRSSSIVADWEFRQANGPGPTPRPPNPALRPQAPYQPPLSGPMAPPPEAYRLGGTRDDGYGRGAPMSLTRHRTPAYQPPAYFPGFPSQQPPSMPGPPLMDPQQGQAPAYGQDSAFDSWLQRRQQGKYRDMRARSLEELMRERQIDYQEYLSGGGQGGRSDGVFEWRPPAVTPPRPSPAPRPRLSPAAEEFQEKIARRTDPSRRTLASTPRPPANNRDVQAAFENPSAWQYQDPQEAGRLAREAGKDSRQAYNAANKNNWLGPGARRSVGNMSSDNQKAYLLMGGFNQNEVNDYMKRNSGKGKKKR